MSELTGEQGSTSISAPTALSVAERRVALERFRLLQPHLEQGVSLTVLTQQAGIPYRTALRWVSLYRRFGLAALARKGRADKGGRRSLSSEIHRAVEGLAASGAEKPTSQTPPRLRRYLNE